MNNFAGSLTWSCPSSARRPARCSCGEDSTAGAAPSTASSNPLALDTRIQIGKRAAAKDTGSSFPLRDILDENPHLVARSMTNSKRIVTKKFVR
jgi:hypothetical protein